ncbi:hypothetical protein [Paraclostridium sp. AKS73]|nr:hypothetical protein [Paraclostridium sp. AKS73]
MDINLISLIIGICDVLIILICLKISKKYFRGKIRNLMKVKVGFY